ncbi:hypothetical protein CFP56_021541 [Quercus suber]|uniref:Conserved oligomeric Golgi complex subunit 1 n=1 Tax=Quercus suber TaxID=58331 RepID=A0AAW0LYK3_QUESU
MATIAAEIPDEFGLAPMERSVLRFLKEHRSCIVWEGEVVSRPDPPPPPHASPILEFPPPPYTSPSLEIPPRTAPTFPSLDIPVPIAYASSHLGIPSPTPCTFFDLVHLSLTLPSFDLGIDFNETPLVMHTQSPFNARSLTKEMQYPLSHIPDTVQHSISVKCIRVSIPSEFVMDVVDRLFVAMFKDLTRVVNVVDTIRAIGEISGGHGQIDFQEYLNRPSTGDGVWFIDLTVKKIRDAVDSRCQSVLQDVLSFLESPKAALRLKDLAPYVQNKCNESMSTILTQLKCEIDNLYAAMENANKEGWPVPPAKTVERSLFIGKLLFAF